MSGQPVRRRDWFSDRAAPIRRRPGWHALYRNHQPGVFRLITRLQSDQVRLRGRQVSGPDPNRSLQEIGRTANTFVGLLFALGTLLAIWTTVIWLPTIQSLMLEKEGIKEAAAAPIIGRNMMLWGIGGIFGYACFGFIADLIGRRPTVAFYNIGTLVLGLTLFLAVNTMAPYPYLLLIYGFFVLGVFSGHAVYIPELFPTHVRATAVSFCNGGARVITSFGPLVAGLLAAPFGGNFNKPAALMTCFALLSIYAMYLGRETRADPLPR